MVNKILSKKELLILVNIYKDHFTQYFKSKTLYLPTYNFINSNYTGIKFTEKVYKYIYGEKYCKQCKVILKSKNFRSFFDGYCKEFCSKFCTYKNPERIQKIKLTKREKYGNENYNNYNKLKQTNLKKYGAEHNWSKNSSNREKCYITNEQKNGSRNWNNTKKSNETKIKNNSYPKQIESLSKTCLKKYNKPFYTQTEEFKIKFKKHFLENYGVDHPAQVAKFHEKNKYKSKNYILPSGKVIKIQGYENLALDSLFKIYKESDIITNKIHMPVIWYFLNKVKRRYYPDIFLEKQKKLIEVKSEYTFNCKKCENLKKQNASKKLGFSHEIWIYDKNKQLLSII